MQPSNRRNSFGDPTERLVGKSEKEIKRINRDQVVKAAKILGVDDYRFLDFGDEPLVATRENLLELSDVVLEIRPDVIISAHYPFRLTHGGGDHGEAARMTGRAPIWRYHNGKKPHRPTSI